MSRLQVESGETYIVGSGETEEWAGVGVDGTLDVDGTLKLVDDPDIPEQEGEPFGVSTRPVDLPLAIPNLLQMQMGTAMFLIGIIGTLLAAASMLKNYVAVVTLFFGVIALLSSGLFGIGLETFWAFVAATCVALIAGGVVRWIS